MMEHGGNTQLFAVFVLSILFLIMLVFTIWKLCFSSSSDDEVVKPWVAKQKNASPSPAIKRAANTTNLALLAGWLLVLFLAWYVSTTAGPLKTFDPFEILGVSDSASERDIKKAYRKLSLQYHPDKNPDPAAHEYFANHIQKAYAALTDEVSRENYIKYGHPDGRQAMSMGIALPEWVFAKDSKNAPIILALLVGCGVLLPLVAAAWFLLRAENIEGADQVDNLSRSMFMHSKFNIKESGGLARMPETLVLAKPFVEQPFLPEQQGPMEELSRAVLRLHPDLREKPIFWKRRPSIIKAHMLLLAHVAREPIPPALDKDLRLVLQRSPMFLAEMARLSSLPRPPSEYGWLTPALASLEYTQCLVQAVPPGLRKPLIQNAGKGTTDGMAALMQLPHMTHDVMKKLNRRKVKVLGDLTALKPADRLVALTDAGLSKHQVDEVDLAMSAIPSLTITSVALTVDGVENGDEIMEHDVVTCNVRLLLSRESHTVLRQDTIKGKATQAFAPCYPFPKPEEWWLAVGDPGNNTLMCLPIMGPISLVEAERAGAAKAMQLATHGYIKPEPTATPAESGTGGPKEGPQEAPEEAPAPTASEYLFQEGDDPEEGQLVSIRFRAPKAGKRQAMLYILCDSWVGADRAVPLRFKVSEQTRAEQEGRTFRGKATPVDGEEEEQPLLEGQGSDQDEEDSEDGSWDSEEGDTEESGTEEEEVEEEPQGGSDKDDAATEGKGGATS